MPFFSYLILDPLRSVEGCESLLTGDDSESPWVFTRMRDANELVNRAKHYTFMATFVGDGRSYQRLFNCPRAGDERIDLEKSLSELPDMFAKEGWEESRVSHLREIIRQLCTAGDSP